MSVKIYLIRHGLTQGNIDKSFIGSMDVPVLPQGIEEIEKYVEQKNYPKVDIVVSSPMLRCRMTAEIIYPTATINYIEDLKEINYGEFEGETHKSLHGTDEYQRWLDSGGGKVPPNAETFSSFQKRVKSGAQQALALAVEQGAKSMAIICHGGVIMSFMESYAQPHKDFYSWYVKNGRGYSFDFSVTNKLATNYEEI